MKKYIVFNKLFFGTANYYSKIKTRILLFYLMNASPQCNFRDND